jgi:hypothetical protein
MGLSDHHALTCMVVNQGTHLPTGHQVLSALPLPHFEEGAATSDLINRRYTASRSQMQRNMEFIDEQWQAPLYPN